MMQVSEEPEKSNKRKTFPVPPQEYEYSRKHKKSKKSCISSGENNVISKENKGSKNNIRKRNKTASDISESDKQKFKTIATQTALNSYDILGSNSSQMEIKIHPSTVMKIVEQSAEILRSCSIGYNLSPTAQPQNQRSAVDLQPLSNGHFSLGLCETRITPLPSTATIHSFSELIECSQTNTMPEKTINKEIGNSNNQLASKKVERETHQQGLSSESNDDDIICLSDTENNDHTDNEMDTGNGDSNNQLPSKEVERETHQQGLSSESNDDIICLSDTEKNDHSDNEMDTGNEDSKNQAPSKEVERETHQQGLSSENNDDIICLSDTENNDHSDTEMETGNDDKQVTLTSAQSKSDCNSNHNTEQNVTNNVGKIRVRSMEDLCGYRNLPDNALSHASLVSLPAKSNVQIQPSVHKSQSVQPSSSISKTHFQNSNQAEILQQQSFGGFAQTIKYGKLSDKEQQKQNIIPTQIVCSIVLSEKIESIFYNSCNNLFTDIDSSKICKLVDELSLLIADNIMKQECLRKIDQLTSTETIISEACRTEKYFHYMIRIRGQSFVPLFMSIVNKIDKHYFKIPVTALYCIIIRQLEKIDPKNASYRYELRKIMKEMFEENKNYSRDVRSFFSENDSSFKATLCFVEGLILKYFKHLDIVQDSLNDNSVRRNEGNSSKKSTTATYTTSIRTEASTSSEISPASVVEPPGQPTRSAAPPPPIGNLDETILLKK